MSTRPDPPKQTGVPSASRYQETSPHPSLCKDCPYPRHGLICWHRDGTCLRTDVQKLHQRG